MSLSPWDLSGNIRFDFPSNRPRRASYLFATQLARRRNESYKNATQKSETLGDDTSTDFIEGVVRTKRKDSYKAATRHPHEHHELADVDVVVTSSGAAAAAAAAASTNHVPVPTIVEVSAIGESRILRQLSESTLIDDFTLSNDVTPVKGRLKATNGHTTAATADAVATPPSASGTGAETPDYLDEDIRRSRWTYRRNLFVLTAGFILVFSAFRSIQNVQSSLNTRNRLGVVTMGVVHLSMFATCLFAPVLINRLTSKWTIVLGLLFYLFWVAANFYPHFYTLLPTSVGVGFGQSLAWGAQVTYMQKLAAGHAQATRELTQYEMYKFNGVFLACFQTSHVWGNLVSSLMLAGMPRSGVGAGEYCGVYDQCLDDANPLYDTLPKNGTAGLPTVPDAVLKLMGAYLVFAFTGFVMILLFLEKIGAKADSEKPCLLMVWHNVRQLTRHKQFRLLIPLLLFNGFEQGFVYSDYNKSYISCAIGIEYVGTNMITLGMTNSVFSIVIGLLSRHVPREAIVGVGSILHVGLMVFLLVWIPASNLKAVYYVISALWGFCDAIWQTQCNYLVNLSCPDDHDVAFQNFRMLQGFGAASVFLLGTFCCVAVKLYIIITLLVVAILLYAAVEYNVRRTLQPEDFDD